MLLVPMTDDLSLLLDGASRHALLTARDEQRLMARVERGDRAARDRMVEANLRLVVHFARRIRHDGALTTSDLVQEGAVGLVRAVDRFDRRRGVRFSTYAAWWIRQAMLQAVCEHAAAVRLGEGAVRRIRELRRARAELAGPDGSAPSIGVLAEHLGMAEEEIVALDRARAGCTSLDAPAGDEDGAPLRDLLPDAGADDALVQLEDGERRVELAGALERLDPLGRRVLELRFGLAGEPPRSTREVAAELGRSPAHVRRAEDLALRRLRAAPEADALRQAA